MKGTFLSIGLLLATIGVAGAQNYPADNTGKNVRDRDGSTLTAGDQPGNERDLAITQEVRKQLIADKGLSLNGHNVKVIAVNGVVTLRGPVDSAQEKAAIAEKARLVAGVTRVENQLEVASR